MKMKLLVCCTLGWFWNFGASIWKSFNEFIKIPKKSDFSPSKFQLVGDVIGCCRSLVRLSVIFTGIYVSATFLSPICVTVTLSPSGIHAPLGAHTGRCELVLVRGSLVTILLSRTKPNKMFQYKIHITSIIVTQMYILLDFINITWMLRNFLEAKFITK